LLHSYWVKNFTIIPPLHRRGGGDWWVYCITSVCPTVNFQWDDDEVCFVLDQHAKLDFYSASSLRQQSAGIHVAPLGHIILIPSQPHQRWLNEETFSAFYLYNAFLLWIECLKASGNIPILISINHTAPDVVLYCIMVT
jgi:hypothetical protein